MAHAYLPYDEDGEDVAVPDAYVEKRANPVSLVLPHGRTFLISLPFCPMNPALLDSRTPVKDYVDNYAIACAATRLRPFHSADGQAFLIAGVRHMNARKIRDILLGINRSACGAPHHLPMPRGQSGGCSKKIQQNTLSCAHGNQFPLQQALLAATVLGVIQPNVLEDYVRIRQVQQAVVLEADGLLTTAYAITTKGKTDDASRQHLGRLGLPLVNATPMDVRARMCDIQNDSVAPLITIMDAVIAALEARFPDLTSSSETAPTAAMTLPDTS